MEATKPKLTWKTVVLPIIGLAAFFLYIYLYGVDIPTIIATAQNANPLLYSAAILISLLEVFFHAVSWRALLSSLQVKLSVVKANLFVWYGIFMDIVIPAESVSGEVCRIYLVTREQKDASGKTVASLVLQRLLGMGINIAALVAGIVLLLLGELQIDQLIFNLILFVTAAIAVILLLILAFSFKENLSIKVINAFIRVGDFITRGKWKLFNKFKEEAYSTTKMFHDSMQEYRRKPRAVIAGLFWLVLNWACSFAVPYLVFLALDFPVSWSVILITSAIVVAVKSIPVGVPFEVGIPEIAMTTLFVAMLGTEYSTLCATVTILSRLLTLWLRFGIGFAAQQWIELKPIVTASNQASTAEKA